MTSAVIELEGVSVHRDGEPVLEDISFSVAAGEFLGIVGPNGAGKTTLLRALLGLVPTSAGRVTVLGEPVRAGASRAPQRLGYVPQHVSINASFPASVLDVVRWGQLRRGGAGALRDPRDVLERVGLGDRARTPVGRLSGGEQRRVLLAQALCASEALLILDEATTGLDLPAEQAFYHLLRDLKHEWGLSVLAVSHDLLALGGEADHLICINRTMHVHGNPADVVHSHALQEAYSCEFDFLRGEIAHHERMGSDSEPQR